MWVRPTGRTKTTQVLSFCLGDKRHNAGALSPIGNARLPVNRAPYAAVAGVRPVKAPTLPDCQAFLHDCAKSRAPTKQSWATPFA